MLGCMVYLVCGAAIGGRETRDARGAHGSRPLPNSKTASSICRGNCTAEFLGNPETMKQSGPPKMGPTWETNDRAQGESEEDRSE